MGGLRRGEVIGPVTAPRPPACAPTPDVAARGYVVEEHYLQGVTAAYRSPSGYPADGRWGAEEVGAAPYRTRLLVVRPADPAAFNGTVVLNWLNVSGGGEVATARGDELYRGFAWVGVSAQEVGVHGWPLGTRAQRTPGRGLVDLDPVRYGLLHHPGDQGSFDIFRQAARAVGPGRDGEAVDPMGGLDVRRVVAAGGSQSAMRLVAYANGVHPLDPAVDAFLLALWEGRAPALEEGADSYGLRTAVRADLGAPVLVVNSEFEVDGLARIELGDHDRLRVWEVAGVPHAPVRDGDRDGDRADDGGGRLANGLRLDLVHEAALRAVHRWLVDGTPPRRQPRIAVEPGGTGPARDELGNAVGGIRLPELAAPVAAYRGVAFGTGRAPLHGSASPLPDDVLRRLHPTREGFVGTWKAAVDRLVAEGTLRPEDAGAERARAAEVRLPHWA